MELASARLLGCTRLVPIHRRQPVGWRRQIETSRTIVRRFIGTNILFPLVGGLTCKDETRHWLNSGRLWPTGLYSFYGWPLLSLNAIPAN